jgi:hypothetical protein
MSLNQPVDFSPGIDGLFEMGRAVFALFKSWKEDNTRYDPAVLDQIDRLAIRISKRCRELESGGSVAYPSNSGSDDELLAFVLKLITETQSGETDRGGLLVFLPDDKTKEWLPKSKIEYQIIEEVKRGEDGKVKTLGKIECQIPRWLAKQRGMI